VVALAPLAWLMTVVYAVQWWATALFAVPLYSTRLAYQRFIEMREMFTQTIGALAEAVDKRDPFTAKHSHRVKEIAVDIGRVMHVTDAELEALEWGGLLHDVGKIGVPDHILRKPGRLTDDEYHAVKQHVVLGDMIVRDLPDIETIRAGVRHHHERWDGKGYLHGLEGEGIPLVARILAVCDAFSAMTTTRPYRKALDLREALVRLEDAAGTQLDERIVTTFTTGIETAPDAPLPGTDDGVRLWTPYRRVA
jgi:HD-GYP domain-containing protein (c-di-GMP phosphodiesterase class II)